MAMYMNKPKLKDIINNMYDVADVENGYNYWFNKILNRCLSMVNVLNTPDTIPSREIMLNLILTGHCVFFKNRGVPRIALTTMYNNQKSPYWYPESAVYAQPALGSGNLKVGVDCEVVYFNYLYDNIFMIPSDGGLLTFIQRYARQLADVESTINIYMVNARLTSFPTASNDNVKTSIERLFDKLTLGKRSVISDNAIVEQFRNVDINRSAVNDDLNSLLIARDKILEQLYRDLGLRMNNPKKAQVNEEEIEANDQLLVVNTADIITVMNEGFEKVNAFLGTDMIAELSDEFKIDETGVNENAIKNEG